MAILTIRLNAKTPVLTCKTNGSQKMTSPTKSGLLPEFN